MRKIIGIATFIGLIAVFSAAANAQIDTRITTSVPFPFIAGGNELPAGEYSISLNRINQSGDLILIESTDGENRIIVLARSRTIADPDGKAGLSFIRFGGDYYLNGVNVFALRVDIEPVVSRSRLVAAASN
ncbi:MAG: hypothetical protein J5I65_12875 [Aridibacter famidurans]|nr:hypothetical protein [Aridibacter famidurans]